MFPRTKVRLLGDAELLIFSVIEVHHIVWVMFPAVSTRKFFESPNFLCKFILLLGCFLDVILLVILIVSATICPMTFKTSASASIFFPLAERKLIKRFVCIAVATMFHFLNLVRLTGLEPAPPCGDSILSAAGLPFPHSRMIYLFLFWLLRPVPLPIGLHGQSSSVELKPALPQLLGMPLPSLFNVILG